MRKKYSVSTIGWVVILFFAAFLRLYHREAAMYWSGDQGTLVSIAYKVLTESKFPLVGPIVTANNFLIPPFNYYLVAFFLLFTKTPSSVALWYFGMNMVSLWFVYKTALERMDRTAGLLTALLFALSASMVTQGRSIWEPHPVVFLISIAVFMLHRAWRDRRVRLLVAAVALYGMSLGIYVSSYVLAPFFLGHVVAWWRIAKKTSIPRAFFLSFGLFAFIVLPVFLPQLMLEMRTGYPSWGAFRSSYFGVPTVQRATMQIIDTGYSILTDVFRSDWIHPGWLRAALTLIIGMLVVTAGVVMYRDRKNVLWRGLVEFLRIPLLLAGAGLTLVYQSAMYPYRLSAFYPMILLLLAGLLRTLITQSGFAWRLVAVLLLSIYSVGNLIAWEYTTIRHPIRDLPRAQTIARFLQDDVQREGLASGQYAVHVFTPWDVWDYEAPPIWYLLSRADGYRYEVVERGNDIARGAPDQDVSRVYLMCLGFADSASATQGCTDTYRRRNPTYVPVTQRTLGRDALLVVFTR